MTEIEHPCGNCGRPVTSEDATAWCEACRRALHRGRQEGADALMGHLFQELTGSPYAGMGGDRPIQAWPSEGQWEGVWARFARRQVQQRIKEIEQVRNLITHEDDDEETA